MGKKGNKGQDSKEDGPKLDAIPNRDILQRLNFLYQASAYLTELGASTSSQRRVETKKYASLGHNRTKETEGLNVEMQQQPTSEETGTSVDAYNSAPKNPIEDELVRGERQDKNKKRKDAKSSSHLARAYVKSMRTIGQKTTVRLNPAVKRALCRGCNSLLVPGLTAKVRSKRRMSSTCTVTYTCTTCSSLRRFPISADRSSMSTDDQ